MKFFMALAFLTPVVLSPTIPALAAKDNKLPRCNGKQKRSANLYGTVLPSVPRRNTPSAATAPSIDGLPRGTSQLTPVPATNLFPAEGTAAAPEGTDASQTGKVPAISAVTPNGGSTAALPTPYASC